MTNGGGWLHAADWGRAVFSIRSQPFAKFNDCGLRLARVPLVKEAAGAVRKRVEPAVVWVKGVKRPLQSDSGAADGRGRRLVWGERRPVGVATGDGGLMAGCEH